MKAKFLLISVAIVGVFWTAKSLYEGNQADKVDYSTQVKPILNKHCITCHGGVKKIGGFSLLFRTDALAKTKSGLTGEPAYLWVGRLDENKDPIVVIKAFIKFLSTCPNAKLFMIFQSAELLPQVEAILKLTPTLQEHIVLVGRVDHDELIDWYNSADFIISSSHYEGSGVAVCEGMSCGCIPILSSIPSFRWMTTHG